MKYIINNFINSIDTKLYSRIRSSKGDAECRRYLKEHLSNRQDNPIKEEIIDLLDNVRYWDTCSEDYKVRIEAVKKTLNK